MKNNLLTIGVILVTLILGLIAILTAARIRQLGTSPVAPNVPASLPKATSGDRVCRLSFAVVIPPVGLKCSRIVSSPADTVVRSGGETRTMTAYSTGGSGAVTFSWTLTSNKANKGTLSSNSGKTVTWTAPPTPLAGQTWSVAASARDTLGATDSSGCRISFSFSFAPTTTPTPTLITGTPTPSPSPTPGPSTTPGPTATPTPSLSPTPTGTASHRACNDQGLCLIIPGAGVDQCASDVSCQPTITPPVVPEAGFSLPTAMIFIGGSTLLLLGLSLLAL